MDDDMDTVNWNEAAERVEKYLAASGIGSRERVLRLTLDILNEARESEQPPVTAAMTVAQRRVDEWFGRLAGNGSGPFDVARGRIACSIIDAGNRWPDAFLTETLPADMLSAARQEAVTAGPALEFRSLVRQEIDYGPMSDIGRETWIQFSWKFTLQAFVVWAIIFFAALGIWIRFFE